MDERKGSVEPPVRSVITIGRETLSVLIASLLSLLSSAPFYLKTEEKPEHKTTRASSGVANV